MRGFASLDTLFIAVLLCATNKNSSVQYEIIRLRGGLYSDA